MGAVLDRQVGISESERQQLEAEWALFERYSIGEPDAVRQFVLRSGVALVKPLEMPHTRPGGVKVSDGEQDWYFRCLSRPCGEMGCKVYLWHDEDPGYFWMQHGERPEAVRRFPKRFLLARAFPCSSERPDVLEWLVDCHDFENRKEWAV